MDPADRGLFGHLSASENTVVALTNYFLVCFIFFFFFLRWDYQHVLFIHLKEFVTLICAFFAKINLKLRCLTGFARSNGRKDEGMRVLPMYSPSDKSNFRTTEQLSFAIWTSEMAAASRGAEPTSIRWKRKGR